MSLCAANAIGAAGAVALASALPTALTSLILSSTPCHAMPCADSYGYALRFGSSGCGGPGAVRLFAANELGAAGATALALVLGSMSQLMYLDLGGDLAHVAERMNWELHLRGGRSFVPSRALRADNSLGAAGATALAPALPLMSLASLDLSSECPSVPTTIGRV